MGSDNNIKIDNDQLAGFTEELRADRFIDDLFAPTRWNLFLLSNMWMNETKRRLQATLLAYSTNKVNARAVQHALTQFEEATAGSRDARNSLSSQMIEEHDPDVTRPAPLALRQPGLLRGHYPVRFSAPAIAFLARDTLQPACILTAA